MKKIQILILFIIFIVIGIIISVVYNADTYSDFNTVIKNPTKEFQVIGKINKQKPIDYTKISDTLKLSFFMFDKANMEQKIFFFGAKPTDFEKSEEIILNCSYKYPNIVASKLLMKCPSKYKKTDKDYEEFISKK